MAAETASASTTVDIVLPVLNEERALVHGIRKLRAQLDRLRRFDARIVIADNGSTDGTLPLAHRLAASIPGVSVLHLEQRGRGQVLRRAWAESTAELVAYMDIDLSTDLAALGPLLDLVASGQAAIAVGSRLTRGARVRRSLHREVISRAYNIVLREALGMPVRDAQCGFKAVRTAVARGLLPDVEDNGWFFDTELLARAQHAGLRVTEIPVTWVEDPDSRVQLVRTALDDLRGVLRLRQDGLRPPPHGALAQLLAFSIIGVISTAAYLGLFNLLRPATDAQVANLIALAVTAAANTAANRRLTFGIRGTSGLMRAQVGGVVTFVLGLTLTAGAVALLHAVDHHASATLDTAMLAVASALATLMRFVVLRLWLRAGRAWPFASYAQPQPL